MIDARKIASSLAGARPCNDGWICRCPAHDDHKPSLSITDSDDGRVLVHCHAGCEQLDVIGALRTRGLWPDDQKVWPTKDRGKGLIGQIRKGAASETMAPISTWEQSHPIAGTIGEKYFRTRKITIGLPSSLRFHPRRYHGLSDSFAPAIIAGVQDSSGHLGAIQRIFVQEDGLGKADLERPKLSLGALGDGAVRLAEASGVLGITEGIEDGLSVIQIYSIPVWCALGASRLHRLTLPDKVRHVLIFADRDNAGESAATKAAAEYTSQNRRATVCFPRFGKDFNEELMQRSGVSK